MGRKLACRFCTLALAQVWHVFNMRDNMRRLINNEITPIAWIWAAVTICMALVLSAVYLPVWRDVLRLSDPDVQGWLVVLGMSFKPVIVAP